MFVVGTAGHVDHGKSVLVHALSGIDPDRLPEEKERGMTIDLGFAWLKLPSGREVSIVDVPGHERFIKNMLAGVGGIDVALLIVAADEGVMPQTREHLAILDILRVERGIVVLTKKDLVDEDWLELVNLDVSEVIQDTSLAEASILAVSAYTREGLDELLAAIDRLLDDTQPKKDVGRPRLPIDRVFTVAGFGTVATGTLIGGQLSVGQELEILPSGIKTRIRGLQVHKHKVDTAMPGNRVAANLAGVDLHEVRRGDVVVTSRWLKPVKALDVKLQLLRGLPRPLLHNTPVTFHTGSSEVLGKVRLLEKDRLEPGEACWAQIVLAKPVATVKGDLFVIRSSQDTLGGGEVIATQAKRHRRFRSDVIESLVVLERGSAEESLVAALEEKQPIELSNLATRCNLSFLEAETAMQALVSEGKAVVLSGKGPNSVVISIRGLERTVKRIVGSHQNQFPLRRGMPKEELRNRLKITPQAFGSVVDQLTKNGILVDEETTVHLPGHQVRLSKEQQATINTFLKLLIDNPYTPPGESWPEPELLNMLVEQRQVVKVSDNVIFAASVYDEMVKRITDYITSNGKITVGEVKDLFETTRKYAVALMEYLDAKRITRRTGDERVLV